MDIRQLFREGHILNRYFDYLEYINIIVSRVYLLFGAVSISHSCHSTLLCLHLEDNSISHSCPDSRCCPLLKNISIGNGTPFHVAVFSWRMFQLAMASIAHLAVIACKYTLAVAVFTFKLPVLLAKGLTLSTLT